MKWIACALLAAGCASPRKYYESTTFELEPLVDSDRANVRRAAADAFGGRIVRVKGPGSPPQRITSKAGLKKQPIYVLRALLALADDQYRGAEADLLIRRKGKRPVPVSVVNDLEGHARVAYGAALPRPGEAPSAKRLRTRFGVGPLREKGAKWSAEAMRALEASFELLSDEERRLLLALPFVRTPGNGMGDLGAQHIVENCGERINVYDRAFLSAGMRFAGEPTRPVPAAALTILHELGHALHARPGRLAYCRYQRRFATLEKRIAALNAKITRYNGHVARRENVEATALRKRIARDEAEIKAMERRVEAAGDESERLTAGGPVLRAYKRVIGATPAPTRYGESSTAESFAESFALFHADPAALRRVTPKVHAWFGAGRHLEALGADRKLAPVASGGAVLDGERS